MWRINFIQPHNFHFTWYDLLPSLWKFHHLGWYIGALRYLGKSSCFICRREAPFLGFRVRVSFSRQQLLSLFRHVTTNVPLKSLASVNRGRKLTCEITFMNASFIPPYCYSVMICSGLQWHPLMNIGPQFFCFWSSWPSVSLWIPAYWSISSAF